MFSCFEQNLMFSSSWQTELRSLGFLHLVGWKGRKGSGVVCLRLSVSRQSSVPYLPVFSVTVSRRCFLFFSFFLFCFQSVPVGLPSVYGPGQSAATSPGSNSWPECSCKKTKKTKTVNRFLQMPWSASVSWTLDKATPAECFPFYFFIFLRKVFNYCIESVWPRRQLVAWVWLNEGAVADVLWLLYPGFSGTYTCFLASGLLFQKQNKKTRKKNNPKLTTEEEPRNWQGQVNL